MKTYNWNGDVMKTYLYNWSGDVMKTYNWSGDTAQLIFNLDTRWGRVLGFMPRPHFLGVRATGIHCTGGWVSPTSCLDEVAKRKTPSLFLPGTEIQSSNL
jgi:hypothetical protein